MRPNDFAEAAPGRLVFGQEGYCAFVPEPLPPNPVLDRSLILQLTEAYGALGELAGVGHRLPNPHLLIGAFLRREAVLSSRIEGTLATAQELLLFEVMPTEPPRTPDVREVANYVRAMEHGLKRLKELPVSLRLLRELHEVLMHGVRGQEKRPGEFRTIQNYVGKPGTPLQEARFVPPPPTEMQQSLNELEKYLHRESEWPFLVELALIHYQFEAIHPFIDGNGRIGRLLISLLLCERKLLPQPLLYLSAYFERHKNEYYDHLLRVSQKGAWLDWIRFFLRGIAEQSRDAVVRSARLLALWEQYRTTMQTPRASALVLRLIDYLFSYPALTIPQASQMLNLTFRSAQANVQRLVEAGILVERTGGRRNRIFVAPEIVSLIETETP